MNRDEALRQIESITEVVNSSTKILLSPPHLIIIGFLLCLIPVINFITRGLTFGANLNTGAVVAINVLFYYALFSIASRVISSSFRKPLKSVKNPLIVKAMKVKYAFIAIFILGSFTLGSSGYSQLIYPFIYILIGLLYNLIGQFSYGIVKVISWTYIVAGLLFVYLTSVSNNNYLWIFFIVYMGVTYIVMGAFILQHQKNLKIEDDQAGE